MFLIVMVVDVVMLVDGGGDGVIRENEDPVESHLELTSFDQTSQTVALVLEEAWGGEGAATITLSPSHNIS